MTYVDVGFSEQTRLFTARLPGQEIAEGESLEAVRSAVLRWADMQALDAPIRFRYSDRAKLAM